MATLSFYIGVIGNLISVLMFLAPVYTFARVVRNRSTEEFKSLPYVCTLLNCILWTYYGIITPGEYLVSTINGFGILVQIVYLSLFLTYATPSKRANTAIWIGVLDVSFPVASILVTLLALKGVARINAIGFLGAGLNIMMYASPLSAMKRVISTESVEFMPFWLSFFFFLNGAVWFLYAWLEQDYFLGVPNGMGFLLGTVQLVLYWIYCAKPLNKEESAISHGLLVEEGRQYEPLVSTAPTT